MLIFFSFLIICFSSTIFFQGDNVPPPFTTFEATGFSSEILREVGTSITLLFLFLLCGLFG